MLLSLALFVHEYFLCISTLIGTSHRQHNFINDNIYSSYFFGNNL